MPYVTMSRRLIFLLLFLFPRTTTSQEFAGFEVFLRQYESAGPDAKSALLADFVKGQQARGGFPLRQSDGDVVFIYIGRGNEKDVRLTGDFRASSFSNVYWDS